MKHIYVETQVSDRLQLILTAFVFIWLCVQARQKKIRLTDTSCWLKDIYRQGSNHWLLRCLCEALFQMRHWICHAVLYKMWELQFYNMHRVDWNYFLRCTQRQICSICSDLVVTAEVFKIIQTVIATVVDSIRASVYHWTHAYTIFCLFAISVFNALLESCMR